jgi:hypothetical protein
MLFTRNLIDLWDPGLLLRNGDKRISFLQVITIPFLATGMIITFIADLITLPYQLKHIYRDDD